MSMRTGNFQLRGSTMAITCVAAIGGTLGAMYLAGRNVKENEGEASPYKQGGLSGGSDQKMTSADVARAVSVPKPGKERLTTTTRER